MKQFFVFILSFKNTLHAVSLYKKGSYFLKRPQKYDKKIPVCLMFT